VITPERLYALWWLLWLTPITIHLYWRGRDFAWARALAWIGIVSIIVSLYIFVIDPAQKQTW
jgi:hypothetical protein